MLKCVNGGRAVAGAYLAILAACLPAPAARAAGADAQPQPAAPLTIEQIMADPDWIGAPVEDAYWSVDERSVYYSLKRPASPIVDLRRVEIASGRDQVVGADAMAQADGPPVYDRDGRHAAFVRNGDVFLRDVGSGRLTQVTRTPQQESAPQFAPDGRLSFRVENDWYVYDPRSAVTAPAAILKLEKDPGAAPKPDDLRDLQLRVFSTLKKAHDDKEALRLHDLDLQNNDATRSAAPFYLGDEVAILNTSLSPDANWLAVVTIPKSAAVGVEGKLTRYVTESGYEEFDKEHVRVGRNPPARQSLLLLNLKDHTIHPLSVDGLPGIHDDPLQGIREENAPLLAAAAAGPGPAAAGSTSGTGSTSGAGDAADPGEKVPPNESRDGQHPSEGPAKPRGVMFKPVDPDGGAGAVTWSRDGRQLAVQVRSIDNKDRWLATVDFGRYALVPQHRLTDAAWIGWTFNGFGWLNDARTLWYESEESGFSHLYIKAPGAAPRALTEGRFEISNSTLSQDGRWFYVLANAEAPYAYDVYRVPSAGGPLARVTRLGGVASFSLARDARRLLVTHSSSYLPSQIAVVRADGAQAPHELTDTRTPAYRSLSWIAPQIVQVPSSHASGAIYAKVYGAGAGAGGSRPAVVFVHGAGYTQDVHLRFPYYFREQMYNNLLVQRGYVVIDLDYRASQGYGRDWRTAIYRQMGHPELEDLLDGKQWLVEHAAVDPHRVGLYGGSYGGFMTLMALFRAPGEFAAGAALRPVTDWTQYYDDYASDILNDPQVDPIAYRRSSPIEFAAGLRDALLICHGVIDDNVLFEDSMRLYQRLIELHKDRFALAPFPLDRHGFTNPDSWLDEYKRIDRLFRENLGR
jgi:dipeptidyl aminopeptidase/acylaminoacyl peptidase